MVNRRNWVIPKYRKTEFFPKKNEYCIVIPILNEGDRLKKQLTKMKQYSEAVDIILADGGTTDDSTSHSFLRKQKVRSHLLNIESFKGGQGTQLRLGLSYALMQGYTGVLTIDGNNKDDVSSIPTFINALEEGYDYIQASRFIKGGKHKNTPIDRIFFNRLLISPVLSIASGKWYTDLPNNFRAYSRDYLLDPKVGAFRDVFIRYEFIFYLCTRANKLGYKSMEIPSTRKYPKGEVPTKIVGWKKVSDLMQIFKIALGFYNP